MPMSFSKFKYLDIPQLIALIVISLAGLALLYSTSFASEQLNIFWRQIIFFFIGWGLFFFFAFFDYHNLAKQQRYFYIIIILFLVYLVVFGKTIRGGNRWITFGFFNFQPAEFAKLVCILGISRILYLQRGSVNSLWNIVKILCFIAIPAGLVLLEPDLGSALVIGGIGILSLFISPISKKYIFTLCLIGILLAGLSWKFFLQDFQKSRIKIFLNPSMDLKGEGYNVRQAVVAVGSGKIFGKGLALGSQSQNKFLPERQTDFIFAASAEQIGFVGSWTLTFLYFFIAYRLLQIMKRAKDDLGYYIAGGVFFLFTIHALVNIGMNIGLLPVTGIPLPFLSAGGSFFLALMIGFGISQNISLQSKILRF
jgi:rod shape determining protein RodA